MRILMVAPPGAGKGTQARRLASRYGIEHLSSGELLRQETASGSELGLEVKEAVERGDLVPDDLILRLVLDRAFLAARRGGYVLDGFPRTVAQAERAWEETERQEFDAGLQAVIHLEVPLGELRRRRRARAGEGRPDDGAEVFEHRLAVYTELTEPLLAFYGERGILLSVEGDLPVDDVHASIVDGLERLVAPT